MKPINTRGEIAAPHARRARYTDCVPERKRLQKKTGSDKLAPRSNPMRSAAVPRAEQPAITSERSTAPVLESQ